MARRPSRVHLWFMTARWMRKFLKEKRQWQEHKKREWR